jgi:hypothetical protein
MEQQVYYSQKIREYLAKVNEGKSPEEWLVRCIKLAANAPEHMRSGIL